MFAWKKSSWKKDSRTTPLRFSIECISPLLSRKSLPSNFTESFSRKYSSLKTSAWFPLSSAETCIRWLWRRKPELRCLSVGELSDRPGPDSASHRGCCLEHRLRKEAVDKIFPLCVIEKVRKSKKWDEMGLHKPEGGPTGPRCRLIFIDKKKNFNKTNTN